MNLNEFEVLKNTPDKLVLVDFWAEWCGPCRALAPVLDQLVKTNPDLSFTKVDIDESVEAATEAVVTAVPTLIFYKAGKEVARSVGLVPKAKLQDIIDRNK